MEEGYAIGLGYLKDLCILVGIGKGRLQPSFLIQSFLLRNCGVYGSMTAEIDR